ncbi:MAG: hypothetical protein M1823_005566 [Watsoniomyces obsoletus]|nr:MAG: hypothetical protein M1823_005566 [Watsoniomyces obsoletus]
MLSLLALLVLPLFIGARAGSLTVTAITTVDGRAVLQCWRLRDAPITSSNAGTKGLPISPLGTLAEPTCFPAGTSPATQVVLPPRKRAKIHAAPSVQFVLFYSGEAIVTLPDPDNESGRLSGRDNVAWFPGGPNGMLIAADVTGDGHYTDYPSDQPTYALQIPTLDGKVPLHEQVGTGPCPNNVVPGYRGGGGSVNLQNRPQGNMEGRKSS